MNGIRYEFFAKVDFLRRLKKVDILNFGKVDIFWIFRKKSGYFVTVSGDLEIKNWFSNEPLLAAKEKK